MSIYISERLVPVNFFTLPVEIFFFYHQSSIHWYHCSRRYQKTCSTVP